MLLPYLKCPDCGRICRQAVDVANAAWAWPLTLGVFVLIVHVAREYLSYAAREVYLVFITVLIPPLVIGMRRGLVLIPVEEEHLEKRLVRKWVIPLGGMVALLLMFGLYTGSWSNMFIGLIVGLFVWAMFLVLSRRGT